MTDAEIAKAKAHFEYGIKCDIFSEPVLSYAETVLEAFDLINRQKAEIERLKEPKMLIANIEVSEDVLEKLINQKVISIANDKADVNFLCDKHIRTEAIKEFAERLKKEMYTERGFSVCPDDTIDNLVKEMAGDTE